MEFRPVYVEVVFPLPFRKAFTYTVPGEFEEQAQIGVRVVAPFGPRVLTGFIVSVLQETSVKEKLKDIYDVLDSVPIFDSTSIKFYEWLSEYYLSSLGEAFRLAIPPGTEVQSKKRISADINFARRLLEDGKTKSPIQKTLLKIFSENETISYYQLQKNAKRKNILSPLRTLEKMGVITIHDETEKAKVHSKTILSVKLLKSAEEVYELIPTIEKTSPKQVEVLLKLVSGQHEMPLQQLLTETKTSPASIKGLEKKEIITVVKKQIERTFQEPYSEDLIDFALTSDQNKVLDEVYPFLQNPSFKVFLLHGVTGSGKTQVYIELVKKVLELGKTVIILVPEIALTPQMTARLTNNFKGMVSVIHSKMSPGERFDSWQNILNEKSQVVIGARSALFSPLKNIGFIIVDEEHDGSYKQDETPRYNGKDAALMRAKFSGCPVLLGSATPSVESMYLAATKKYQLLNLPIRVDDAQLPKITLVNINEEKKLNRMESFFSKTLLEKIEERLKKKEGVIILQNRRGFATQIYCVECGQIETCDNCSISLVYHINENTLHCHYCGFVKEAPPACNHCGSPHLKYFGTGTERVEDELAYYFPNAVLERIDSDAISKKGNLGTILSNFKSGVIDILVGTQMVAKGMDFPRVTLVGVISAETNLWLPDFRADERTFQLLTQVSGRAGRSKIEGEVVIQTQNDKHFVLQKVLQNDYDGFYKKEILDREHRGYPPFMRLAVIEAKDKEEKKALGAMKEFYNELLAFKKYLKITSPTSAVIARLKGEYRFQIVLKTDRVTDPSGSILRKAISESFMRFNRKTKIKDIKIFFDIDPQSIL